MTGAIVRPGTDEYGAFYAGYVGRVPDGEVLALLTAQPDSLGQLLHGLTEDQANGTFASGEWSIKEVVGHLVDAERTFSYRSFCFSRNERNPLPGFDQDAYVREANFKTRTLADLLEELTLLRCANLIAFRQITPEVSLRRGVASGVEVSVRALVYILAGHLEYHLEDLGAKYLPAVVGG